MQGQLIDAMVQRDEARKKQKAASKPEKEIKTPSKKPQKPLATPSASKSKVVSADRRPPSMSHEGRCDIFKSTNF